MRLMAEGVVAPHSGARPNQLNPKPRILGDQRAEVLAQLVRLMAQGVVAPHSGTLPR